MDLYVGNLAFSVTEGELEKTFSKYGTVSKVKLIMDRDTGRSKGFAFISMDSDDDAKDAISNLNGFELQSRAMKVNESEKRENSGGGPRRTFDRSGNSSGGDRSSRFPSRDIF